MFSDHKLLPPLVSGERQMLRMRTGGAPRLDAGGVLAPTDPA